MSIEQRIRGKLPGPGPYLAKITNLLDPTYMGSMEVVIEKGSVGDIKLQSQTYIVKYLMPFYGVTNVRHEGTDQRDFNSVQKSYGMWMVPPDIGTSVLVIFVGGDPNQGYWMGCVADQFQDHMVPGIAASQDTYITPEQELKYGTKNLPVAEFHKRSIKEGTLNPNSQQKPIHPFADRLLAQGLLLDNIRGVTSSSARREVPSMVFGISTPGPIDKSNGAQQGAIGYDTKVNAPVSRLGGTQFVMDDGDASGQNELVRIRTRTGHQILLHNSSDLIYIANSKGTAWIELTSNGKIDIYAEDSISMHTENDFNFRADRDINIEAGRNLNIKVTDTLNTNVTKDYNLLVNQTGKIYFSDDINITSASDFKLQTGGSINTTSGTDTKITAAATMNIAGEKGTLMSSGAQIDIGATGRIIMTGSQIHSNGPAAAAAATATVPEQPTPLQLFSLPNRNPETGWSNGNFFKGDTITSIMQRVPTHEPWDQHENTNAEKYTPTATDVAVGATTAGSSGQVPISNPPLPPPNNKQPADWASDKEFITKVKEVSANLGCSYTDLLACMAFETGRTYNPALRNFIGATGLIQFISSTAKGLGTTTDYLATLTRTQQMTWVEKYFKAGPVAKIGAPSLEDLYMQILWPKAVGQANTYVLFNAGTKQYSQNNGLDIGKKGYITKEDAAAKVRQQIPYVTQQLANAGYTV